MTADSDDDDDDEIEAERRVSQEIHLFINLKKQFGQMPYDAMHALSSTSRLLMNRVATA